MIKSKYSKDNLYLRALEKEKTSLRIKESNKKMRKIADQSKERIRQYKNREFQRRNGESHKTSSLYTLSKIAKSYNESESSHHSDPDTYLKSKMMQPISVKANEYEKAIQQFLGVNQNDIEIDKLKKIKKPREVISKRPKSSMDMASEENVRADWDDELRKIEQQERNLQKNLKELNYKQKNAKVNSKSFNSPIKATKKGPNDEIFQSLEQVNQLLTNFLKKSGAKAVVAKRNK